MQTKTELYNSVVSLAYGIEEHINNGWKLNKESPAGHFGLAFQVFFEKEEAATVKTPIIVKAPIAKPAGKK